MNTIIDELQELNGLFAINDKNGRQIDGKSYIYHNGSIPILLSAPHAVRQQREGEVKVSDYLTGPLALYLAKICDCSYFVRVHNDFDDPNYPVGVTLTSVQNEYLKALLQYIKDYKQLLVIDIHGCSNNKLSDCSIWTDEFIDCSPRIVNIFTNNFLNSDLSVNNGTEFLGGQVTRQVGLITNAFQLEIKRRLRNLKNPELLKTFIASMEKSINETYDSSMRLTRTFDRQTRY